MNISIVTKHFELTPAIREHVEKVIAHADKFHLDFLGIKVILSSHEKNNKGFETEIIFQLSGKDSVIIRQFDKDLYAAVDKAMNRANNALSRHHDKAKSHKVTKRQDVPMVSVENDDLDNDIVPADFDIDKPVDIDEAVEIFKQSGSTFIVFEDKTNKTRVMYQRKDGKLGLY
jgi:putative sigma-54 modulation protein